MSDSSPSTRGAFRGAVKRQFRSRLPAIHALQTRLRGLPAVQRWYAASNYRQIRQAVAERNEFLPIEISGAVGFGGILTMCVMAMYECEQLKLKPWLRITSPTYSPDPQRRPDWLGDYFDWQPDCRPPMADSDEGRLARFLPYRTRFDLTPTGFDRAPSIDHAHRLFARHLAVQDRWLREADDFVARQLSGPTLGVHFRGTDKWIEAAPPEWQLVRARIDARLDEESFEHLFIATDEPAFLDYMVRTYGRPRVVDLDCREIFAGQAVHFTAGDARQKGREALLTMLVLARCDACLRTASHLSAWSKILNPALAVEMLSKPVPGSYHFPDSTIWEECQQAPVQQGTSARG